MGINFLSRFLPHKRKRFLFIIWSEIVIVNHPFVMCYKPMGDLFLIVGDGQYPKRWPLLGMLLLAVD